MEQVTPKEVELPSDEASSSASTTLEKRPLEEVNFITKADLPPLILQMILDLCGLKIEEDEFNRDNLKLQLKQLQDSIAPTMTIAQHEKTQKEIYRINDELRNLQNEISDKSPDLKIARLPEQQRMRLFAKRVLLRSLGFLPALGILTWNILNMIFTGFGAGNLGAFCLVMLLSLIGFGVFSDFSFQLYLQPAEFFKQANPEAIAQNPTALNKLSFDWLTKVGLHRIEQAIVRFGQLAGAWDNKAAELQALLKQAEKDNNEKAKEKVKWHIDKLNELKAKLQERLAILQKSREHLLSLKTYDMKLMEIESEIKEFSRDVEKFLAQSTVLLKQIRDTINLALSAEVENLINEQYDPDFNQLRKLIKEQAEAGGRQII